MASDVSERYSELVRSLAGKIGRQRNAMPETAINGWGHVKQRLDAASGVQDWRLHDLRRTLASGLARQGFEPFIVERTLNHATTAASPLAKVYQRYDYDKEKR